MNYLRSTTIIPPQLYRRLDFNCFQNAPINFRSEPHKSYNLFAKHANIRSLWSSRKFKSRSSGGSLLQHISSLFIVARPQIKHDQNNPGTLQWISSARLSWPTHSQVKFCSAMRFAIQLYRNNIFQLPLWIRDENATSIFCSINNVW